jgi:diaminopimelate epimerase
MGEPKFGWQDIPLSKETDTLHMGIGAGEVKDPVGINVGNPHAVFFVNNVEALDVQKIGPGFETDALFPNKINVEFAEVKTPTQLRMRVWERNAGETHACGSGACAVLVAAVRRGLAERKADVVLDGGTLSIHWREDNNRVFMTGPAAHVFDGTMADL